MLKSVNLQLEVKQLDENTSPLLEMLISERLKGKQTKPGETKPENCLERNWPYTILDKYEISLSHTIIECDREYYVIAKEKLVTNDYSDIFFIEGKLSYDAKTFTFQPIKNGKIIKLIKYRSDTFESRLAKQAFSATSDCQQYVSVKWSGETLSYTQCFFMMEGLKGEILRSWWGRKDERYVKVAFCLIEHYFLLQERGVLYRDFYDPDGFMITPDLEAVFFDFRLGELKEYAGSEEVKKSVIGLLDFLDKYLLGRSWLYDNREVMSFISNKAKSIKHEITSENCLEKLKELRSFILSISKENKWKIENKTFSKVANNLGVLDKSFAEDKPQKSSLLEQGLTKKEQLNLRKPVELDFFMDDFWLKMLTDEYLINKEQTKLKKADTKNHLKRHYTYSVECQGIKFEISLSRSIVKLDGKYYALGEELGAGQCGKIIVVKGELLWNGKGFTFQPIDNRVIKVMKLGISFCEPILTKAAFPNTTKMEKYFSTTCDGKLNTTTKYFFMMDRLIGENFYYRRVSSEEGRIKICFSLISNYLLLRKRNILRMDFNPKNIMIGPDGETVFLDFGGSDNLQSSCVEEKKRSIKEFLALLINYVLCNYTNSREMKEVLGKAEQIKIDVTSENLLDKLRELQVFILKISRENGWGIEKRETSSFTKNLGLPHDWIQTELREIGFFAENKLKKAEQQMQNQQVDPKPNQLSPFDGFN